jgi:hypothetical protein
MNSTGSDAPPDMQNCKELLTGGFPEAAWISRLSMVGTPKKRVRVSPSITRTILGIEMGEQFDGDAQVYGNVYNAGDTVDVIKGEGSDDNGIRIDASSHTCQYFCVPAQVPMGEHDPFGCAGGARGVEYFEGGFVPRWVEGELGVVGVGLPQVLELPVIPGIQGEAHRRSVVYPTQHLPGLGQIGFRPDEPLRPGVIHDAPQFKRAVQEIHRNGHSAHLGEGVIQGDLVDAVGQHGQTPVSRPQSCSGEPVRQAVAGPVQFPEGDVLPFVPDSRSVRIVPGGVFQVLGQIHRNPFGRRPSPNAESRGPVQPTCRLCV